MIRQLTAMAALGVLVLIAGSARADDKAKDKPETSQNDQELFQGMWKAEKAVRAGMEGPADEVGKMMIEFKGNKAAPQHNGRTEKEAEFKLDGSKSPKTIDISTPDGKMVKGIYEIKGDTLKLCFVDEGERPTKFESAEGSKAMLIVLKRQKK